MTLFRSFWGRLRFYWGRVVMGGRPQREGIYVYIGLIHFIVQQKLTYIVKQLQSIKTKQKES